MKVKAAPSCRVPSLFGSGSAFRGWQSLQQLQSQLLISPRLPPIAVAAALVGLAALLTVRPHPRFTEQWRATQVSNGAIEEDCTCRTLIKVFHHPRR